MVNTGKSTSMIRVLMLVTSVVMRLRQLLGVVGLIELQRQMHDLFPHHPPQFRSIRARHRLLVRLEMEPITSDSSVKTG